jgi:hypothetical protein
LVQQHQRHQLPQSFERLPRCAAQLRHRQSQMPLRRPQNRFPRSRQYQLKRHRLRRRRRRCQELH